MNIHVHQYPSKRWGFVGSVPTTLAFDSDHAGDIATACGSGLHIAQLIAQREGRSINTRVFDTENAARDFASEQGFTLSN